ncbi:MAG: transcription termination factor Rho [Thermoleophilaceae bacterium]|nr:transcription termination factor Rho [Thermoleophilaceae bacterium]
MAILDRAELERSPLADLHMIASELGIEGYRALRRDDLIDALLKQGGGESTPKSSSSNGSDDGGEKPAGRTRSRGGRGGRGRSRSGTAAKDEGKDDSEDAPPRRGRAKKSGADDADAAAEGARAEEADGDAPEDDGDDEESRGETRTGVLDVLPNGSGFMRPDPFAHSREDVYVSPAQIRRCELRAGDEIAGPVRSPRRSERYPSLVRVESINGGSADPAPDRRRFEDGTPVFASEKLPAPKELASAPFGRGSRVAVGGPPGSGITTLLRTVALELAKQDDIDLTVVLAGVRPEEVTEWRREESLRVVGGAFDRPVDEQSQAAEIAVERAKRRVESGGHAAIVLDSLDALPPAVARRLFGAARCLEEGGTLTVIASTGLAGEPQRLATTQIVLEGDGGGKLKLAPSSGTLQADRLK